MEQPILRNLLHPFFFNKSKYSRIVHPKSTFTPMMNDPCINTFQKLISRDLALIANKRNRRWQNIPKEEINALRALGKDQHIIIKEADKGGAVAILNRTDYVQEIRRQLSGERDLETSGRERASSGRWRPGHARLLMPPGLCRERRREAQPGTHSQEEAQPGTQGWGCTRISCCSAQVSTVGPGSLLHRCPRKPPSRGQREPKGPD